MKTSEIKERWVQIGNQKGYLQRLDPNHPMDLFIGVNEKGCDEIVLFTAIEPSLMKSSKALSIEKKLRKDGVWATQIASVEAKNRDIFAKLCLDLFESSENASSEQEGLFKMTQRFLAWQKLFESLHSELSKQVLKGLVGEMHFASAVLAHHFSWDVVISAWQGPDGADRDFILEDGWFEIKSLATGKDKISISSLNQLEVDTLGYIVKINIDESSSTDPSAKSVSSTINEIRKKLMNFPCAATAFEKKLISVGYIDKQPYENIYFRVGNLEYYKVDDTFPRLIPSNVPKEVVSAKYDLSTVSIISWRQSEEKVWNSNYIEKTISKM